MAFKKGQSGNPEGRPKGGSTRGAEIKRRLNERSHEWVDKVIEMALSGDTACLKMWGDKIVANAKEGQMEFDLPNLIGKTPEQLVTVLFEAMSGQRMSADEINCVLNMIKTFRSSDDSEAIKQVIDKSNEILEELRLRMSESIKNHIDMVIRAAEILLELNGECLILRSISEYDIQDSIDALKKIKEVENKAVISREIEHFKIDVKALFRRIHKLEVKLRDYKE